MRALCRNACRYACRNACCQVAEAMIRAAAAVGVKGQVYITAPVEFGTCRGLDGY
jgi:hypothetical protein